METVQQDCATVPSLDEICTQYYNYVRRRIWLLTHDNNRVEDLTQTAFEKVTRYYHNLRYDTNVKAWLFVIATRTVYDAARVRNMPLRDITCSLSILVNENGAELEPEDHHSSLEDRTADHELRMQAFQSLNPNSRELLVAYFIHNEPVEDIKKVYAARRLLNEMYWRLCKKVEQIA